MIKIQLKQKIEKNKKKYRHIKIKKIKMSDEKRFISSVIDFLRSDDFNNGEYSDIDVTNQDLNIYLGDVYQSIQAARSHKNKRSTTGYSVFFNEQERKSPHLKGNTSFNRDTANEWTFLSQEEVDEYEKKAKEIRERPYKR
jgi:hypothetical protein